jgi:dihydropteroate synthase
MGVLNVTPDSFSDGGLFLDAPAAIAHGRELVRQGADVVDVGGESTRPGADPVAVDEELARVLPVVEALAEDGETRISIDTRKAEVADAAVTAGASLVNDVSASPALAEVAADRGAGWVAMHMQGEPGSMQHQPAYDDVVAEVHDLLVERAEQAGRAGVQEVWLDPGIGFGKTLDHNLALLAHLEQLTAAGWPVVLGVSRKSSVGVLTAQSDARGGHPDLAPAPAAPQEPAAPAPVHDRLDASLALAAWSVGAGVGMVRVHDVAETVRALDAAVAVAAVAA